MGGESGSEIIVHPPEVREPVPLTIHHLPVAVTFALFQVGASWGDRGVGTQGREGGCVWGGVG